MVQAIAPCLALHSYAVTIISYPVTIYPSPIYKNNIEILELLFSIALFSVWGLERWLLKSFA